MKQKLFSSEAAASNPVKRISALVILVCIAASGIDAV